MAERRHWRDPETGDALTLSERISWVIQGLFRRWTFVLLNVALSLFWWTHPTIFHDDGSLTRWMAVYSLLAVVIESVVGIAMFGQAKRDARVLRETHAEVSELRRLLLGVRTSQARQLKLARVNDIAVTDLDNRIADLQERLDGDH
jgi:hypothetical protein